MNRVMSKVWTAACSLGLVLVPMTSLAAPAVPGSSGQGLEISPPVLELPANPGQTITANIRLRNVTSGDLVVTGKADDFGAKGENGEPQLLLDETEATRYSLKFWIQSVQGFRLAPQETQVAHVQINVPQNAEPGGHYGVIRFTGLPPDLSGTGVALSASIGTLVLLKVSGNITEKLSLAEMFVSQGGEKHSFFESGPLTLTERIRNQGSVHEKPDGTVKVYDTFGKQIASMPVSTPPHNVLPDSIRKFEQPLATKNLFGHYTAKLAATYGSGKSLTGVVSFWVIPWKLLLLIFGVLVALYLISKLGIRRYNQKIIARARKQ